MRHIKILITVCIGFCVCVLIACGQKGDLYLPAIPPAPNVVTINSDADAVSKDTVYQEQTAGDQAKTAETEKVKN